MLPLPVRIQIRQLLRLCIYREPFLRGVLVAGYRAQSSRYHVRYHGYPYPCRGSASVTAGSPGDPGLFQADAGEEYIVDF